MLNTSLLFVVGLYLSPVSAWAGVQFIWRADGSVEVGVSRSVVAGSAREGQITEMVSNSGNVKVSVLPFSNSFIAVSWVDQGKDFGYLVILERQNSRYYAITKPVRGPAEGLMPTLQQTIKNLEVTRRWDSAIALRALAEHFVTRPNDTLTEFYAAIQQGQVKTLPRPDRKGTRIVVEKPSRQNPPKVVEAPAAPAAPAPRARAAAPDAVTSSQQPRPRRRVQERPMPPTPPGWFSGGFLPGR